MSVGPLLVMPIVKEGFVDTGGATSFVQRHPLKDVQVPWYYIHGSKNDTIKSSQSQKKVQAADKAAQLHKGVDIIIQAQDNTIEDLAAKLSMKPKAIHVIINSETNYTKQHHPNTFNALIHKTMIDMNNGISYFFS